MISHKGDNYTNKLCYIKYLNDNNKENIKKNEVNFTTPSVLRITAFGYPFRIFKLILNN